MARTRCARAAPDGAHTPASLQSCTTIAGFNSVCALTSTADNRCCSSSAACCTAATSAGAGAGAAPSALAGAGAGAGAGTEAAAAVAMAFTRAGVIRRGGPFGGSAGTAEGAVDDAILPPLPPLGRPLPRTLGAPAPTTPVAATAAAARCGMASKIFVACSRSRTSSDAACTEHKQLHVFMKLHMCTNRHGSSDRSA